MTNDPLTEWVISTIFDIPTLEHHGNYVIDIPHDASLADVMEIINQHECSCNAPARTIEGEMTMECQAIWTGTIWDTNGCRCQTCIPDYEEPDTTVATLRSFDATDVMTED